MSPYNDTFKALADPTRREMIRFLKERNMTAGEIADQFKISKPSISHHLNILKQAGLVTDERKGQTIVYALDTSVFEEVMRMMFDLFYRKEESKDKQTNK
ncbi:MAG: autorepressor SdpR family transcription factor [Candidatus Dehalobacter alkaniphilus]|nr:autorepressor SdpR family transcription factor [Dehalobacter sp.]